MGVRFEKTISKIMKLSIITINYNNKEGLQKTIDSVVSQTWRDFEWIVIDGGSTDGSKELIEQYQQYFAYWCSEPDKGVYNAMNKGIDKAKGEYLNFMNSGDCFVNASTLQDVFSNKLTSDIVAGPVLLSNGQRLYQYQENYVRMLVCSALCHQSSFFKRNLFEHYRYREDFQLISDWVGLVEWLLFKGKTLQYLDVDVALYDVSGMSNNGKLLQEERLAYFQERLGSQIGSELPRLYKEVLYLSGELEIPAIKMLRYLYYKAPKWFSVLYRLIAVTVKVKNWFSKE